MEFDLVIFDCDGVLVDSEGLVNQIESGVVGQLGLVLSPAEAGAAFKGRTVPEVAAILEERLAARLPTDWTYDWAMATALGFVQGLRPVPGVSDVLDAVERRGVATCVASQSPRPRVALCLSLTGLAPRFGDRIHTAARVPRGKPSPDVFLFAAARTGVEPARCAVVEDSESGVRAGVAAGMSVFGYAAAGEGAALAAAGATVFDAMPALPALLAAAPARSAPSSDLASRLRGVYQRFASGDPGPMAEFLADDVVYHLPGRHLGGGTLSGRGAVLERTAMAACDCEAPPRMGLLGVAASADVALSVERLTARRRGRSLDDEVCVVWRVARGQCVEMWSRFANQAACDRFWQETADGR